MNTEQSNYFIIDSFFSVKSSITDLLSASPANGLSPLNFVNDPMIQTYNKSTIQPNGPQLSLQSRGIMKARRLMTSTSDEEINYDTLHIKFPEYFIESGNPKKRIEVEICRLYDMTLDEPYEMAASMHSDIWNINDSADHYICSTNTLYNNPKCYTVGDNRSVFEVWFYRPDGSVIDLDPIKTRAIIEFVLKY